MGRIKVKRTEQVRYMLMSLKEAYSKFKDENCSIKIGLAKFCELRPTHVKLFDKIPHQVCVCSYHENVMLLLVALKDHVILGTDFSEFIDHITCDSSNKECMNGECSSCQNSIDAFVPDDGTSILCYQQWRSVDNRAEKVDISGTAEECFLELQGQVRPFLLHTYTKRNQSASFKSLVTKCNGKSVVLQVDFSENATIASQREIQSAHWNHGQATLFTAHAWISNDVESQSCSMVIVSDDLNHTKHSVYVYMQSIFAQLMASYPGIEKMDVFSDGPTSQFKQRFLFSNLYGWEMEHGLKISWNFFATSHGKGVVDGIGGTVKRAVWRYVKAEQSHVTDPQQYAALARQLCPKVRIEYIPKEEIAKHTSFLDKKWETTKAIPGTHQVHCVQADGSDYVIVSDTTNSAESR